MFKFTLISTYEDSYYNGPVTVNTFIGQYTSADIRSVRQSVCE